MAFSKFSCEDGRLCSPLGVPPDDDDDDDDIRNYAKKAFYLRYPKKLFWISEIVIYDIWNSFLDI